MKFCELVTVKQVVFIQFRFFLETKICMTFLEKLTLSYLCGFVYQEESPLSLLSTCSELSCPKIYLKEVRGYLSFVLEHLNQLSHKQKPNYLHPSRWAFQAPLFRSFPRCACWCFSGSSLTTSVKPQLLYYL